MNKKIQLIAPLIIIIILALQAIFKQPIFLVPTSGTVETFTTIISPISFIIIFIATIIVLITNPKYSKLKNRSKIKTAFFKSYTELFSLGTLAFFSLILTTLFYQLNNPLSINYFLLSFSCFDYVTRLITPKLKITEAPEYGLNYKKVIQNNGDIYTSKGADIFLVTLAIVAICLYAFGRIVG
jgi:L-asparagine transporter-like permease